MPKLFYDLHIHSCLSPCGDDDMTPANIVAMAFLKGLNVIAVTDHNSCKNCPAVLEYARKYQIIAIPGMELCTKEEVHVLCLFKNLSDALCFDEYVSSKLIKIPNNESIFGKQEIYDENDHIIGTEPYLLINATEISFDEIGDLMQQFHGIYIPAHMDKSSNSLFLNLGFIPPEVDFHCVEFTSKDRYDRYLLQNPYLKQCNLIINSDAHSLGNINEPVNYLTTKNNSIEEILKSLDKF